MSSIAGLPVDTSNISNVKDILLMYNQITEVCFTKCVYTLNYRTMTQDEDACIGNCSETARGTSATAAAAITTTTSRISRSNELHSNTTNGQNITKVITCSLKLPTRQKNVQSLIQSFVEKENHFCSSY